MICPKCGFGNPKSREDCARCGVIFAKIHGREGPPPEMGEGMPDEEEAKARVTLGGLIFSSPEEDNLLFTLGRAVVLLVVVVWGANLIFSGIEGNAAGESLLHLVNLPFHEAGHVLFRPLGAFMTSLGGTLGQLVIPLICLVVLLFKTRDPFGAAVCFWWFGENFLDMAPYINDARTGKLPLVGGNFGHSSPYGFHDWEYLLTETGLIRLDHALARLSHGLGSLIMVVAVVWGGYLVWRQYRKGREEGKRLG